jgi:hypothetical protein
MKLTTLGLFFLIVAPLAAQDTQQSEPQPIQIQDPAQLLGKKVIIGRGTFVCQPNTYTVDTSRSGKLATVVSVTPKRGSSLSQSQLSRMPEQMREMMLDQQKAATIVYQFEDGKKLDSCAPLGPKALSEGQAGLGGLLLAPGETLASAPAAAPIKPAGEAAIPASSTVDRLSDDEVRAALAGAGKDHLVNINDNSLMAAQGALGTLPHITLLFPEAFIAIRSEQAKKQFLAYDPTEEDRERALIVFAQGYVGKTVGEGCESITRLVLLSDEQGTVVEESYTSETGSEVWSNAFGASNYCQWLRAKFRFSQVQHVRASAKDGEFYIAVFAGSVRTKTYKIKHRFQEHLPWPAPQPVSGK